MPLLGAHMSIAGGYFKAVDAAIALGMDTVQSFAKIRPFGGVGNFPNDLVVLKLEAIATRSIRTPRLHRDFYGWMIIPLPELSYLPWNGLIADCEDQIRTVTTNGGTIRCASGAAAGCRATRIMLDLDASDEKSRRTRAA